MRKSRRYATAFNAISRLATTAGSRAAPFGSASKAQLGREDALEKRLTLFPFRLAEGQ